MISFDAGSHHFNLRSAAVVLRGNDVLLHRFGSEQFWSLPGGRIEAGESAAEALNRELREELAEPVECGRLIWVIENFYSTADKRYHEVGLYFDARVPAGSRLLATNGHFAGAERDVALTFAWFDRTSLAGLDVRPSFLVKALASPTLEFQHIVQRD
jgi:ADP-ribose pyrophosphatase YjhB (NUDIX family)